MEKVEDWRERVAAAIEDSSLSLREVSLKAGVSHGYLHGVLKDGKEPSLDRFIRICRALDLSVSYALMGVKVSREAEMILQALDGDPERRSAVLALLRQAVDT